MSEQSVIMRGIRDGLEDVWIRCHAENIVALREMREKLEPIKRDYMLNSTHHKELFVLACQMELIIESMERESMG